MNRFVSIIFSKHIISNRIPLALQKQNIVTNRLLMCDFVMKPLQKVCDFVINDISKLCDFVMK